MAPIPLDLQITTETTFDLHFGTPWWSVVGAGSAAAALSDVDNSTYVRANTFSGISQPTIYTLPGPVPSTGTWVLDDRLFNYGTFDLAANKRINAVRLRVNVVNYSDPGGTFAPGLFTIYTYAALGAPGVGGTGMDSDGAGHYFPSAGTIRGPMLQTVLANADARVPLGRPGLTANYQQTTVALGPGGIFHSPWWSTLDNGRFFDQAVLNSLRALITMRAPDGNTYGGYVDAKWSGVTLEVDVRTQPTVQVFSSVGTALGATVQWASTMNDGDPQAQWQLALFTQAQTTTAGFNAATSPAVYRASGNGSAKAALIAATLTIGATYKAYVRVAKNLGIAVPSAQLPGLGTTSLFYSDWANNTVFITPVDTATYTPQLPSEGVLGCHDWTVTAATRGGTRLIADIPWSSLQWGRRLQDVSAASVTFPVDAKWQTGIRPWEHEIGFWRDSEAGPQLEWVGPVTGRTVSRDQVTLRARDYFTLFEHRRVHDEHQLNTIELATIFAAIATDGLAVENDGRVGIVIHSTGILADRNITGGQFRRCADVLRELGRAGVEWTMIARTLLAGGVEFGIAPCRMLLDEHVVDISGDENGESAATEVTVVGKQSQGVGIVGTGNALTCTLGGVAVDPRGVLETVINSSDIEDTASALAYACSSYALLSGGVPRKYEVTLDDQAQTPYGRLIPGARWPVDLPSLALRETLRLRSVDVNIQRTPDGQTTETAKVELTSLGNVGF